MILLPIEIDSGISATNISVVIPVDDVILEIIVVSKSTALILNESFKDDKSVDIPDIETTSSFSTSFILIYSVLER